MNILKRSYIAKLLIDILLGGILCVPLAFNLRLEGIMSMYAPQIPKYILFASVSLLAAEIIWRLPMRAWRCSGIPDLVSLFKAMVFFALALSGPVSYTHLDVYKRQVDFPEDLLLVFRQVHDAV